MHLVFIMALYFASMSVSASEMELSFSGAEKFSLKGTLQVPDVEREKINGCMLLLPGSGPTDREGNQPPRLSTNLLKQIAETLSISGIATFRFDKRAAHVYKEYWPANPKDLPVFFSWDNHAADVIAAFKTMKQKLNLPMECGILGHSEGGLLALSVAGELKPGSLILMGTPGRTMSNILIEQIKQILVAQGASDTVQEFYRTKMKDIHAHIIMNGEIPNDIPDGLRPLYAPASALYFKSVLPLDPTTLVENYKGAVLLMNGEWDIQVNPIQDMQALFNEFEKRTSGIQEMYLVPGASHNFKHVSGPDEPGFFGEITIETKTKLMNWMRDL